MTLANLLIAATSYTLAMRFKQINMRLEEFDGKRSSETFWRSIRLDYALLSGLCKETDDALSGLTLFGYASNVLGVLVIGAFIIK